MPERRPASDLKKQGIRALLWDLSGKFGAHSIGLIFSIFMARLLEPSDFGLLAMVMVYVGVAGVFSDVGLASALVQREKATQVHYSSVFYFNLASGALLTAITYFSADLIGRFYETAKLVPIAELMSISFLLGALGSVQAVKLRKELNYSALTKAGLFASIVSGCIGLVLALNGFGVYSLVAQALLMNGVRSFVLWYMSGWAPSLHFSIAAMSDLWGFGLRMFLASLLNAISSRLDILVIGKLFPVATLGYFDLANRLSSIVNRYTADSLMSVVFPVLSRIQSERDRFNTVVLQALRILSPIVFLVIGVLFLVSDQLIVLLYSEKWMSSAVYFKLLMLAGFAFPLNALLVNVLSSKGNSKGFLHMAVAKKLVFFANFITLFTWGIEAYLVGLIIVGLVSTSITLLYASREMRISILLLGSPIISQGLIFMLSLLVVVALKNNVSLDVMSSIPAEVLFFIFLFLVQNVLLKTESWRSVRAQLWPVT